MAEPMSEESLEAFSSRWSYESVAANGFDANEALSDLRRLLAEVHRLRAENQSLLAREKALHEALRHTAIHRRNPDSYLAQHYCQLCPCEWNAENEENHSLMPDGTTCLAAPMEET